MEPRWLTKARGYLGQREIPGPRHNPLILKWWKAIKAQFTDDETAWCAAFVGGVLEECGIKSTRSGWARSYEKWGVALPGPAVGAVAVFSRKGGGHVGFVVGDSPSRVSVLGGNQSDAVTIAKFPKHGGALKITGYRWPAGEPLPQTGKPEDVEAPDGGRVTFGGFDPGEEIADDKPKGMLGRVLQWMNAIGTAAAAIVAAIADNTATVAIVVGAGVFVFLVIWFTTKRD
jgi:uncharacterized protein (TIGR02594 family)